MKRLDCQQTRRDYSETRLLLSDMPDDPIVQFVQWYQEAVRSGNPEPNAMVLSTVDALNQPDSRVVLLKEIDDDGFVFFTHYASTKGQQLEQNAHVALNFYWHEVCHQVRIRGIAQRISYERSAAYFATRSRESQCAVYAAVQSTQLNESALDEDMADAIKHFENQAIPCPTFWGGYCVKPVSVEFFQGRRGRLHDRMCYTKNAKGDWLIQRLSP
ncbi:MAG: pyridoxamine 5'-phosphate oxidase [Gammaproteobacteria bacterium]|nr:pyridoxamine 5'-phosphate oxidase [Gammaproteobacteria bacterium]